MTRVAGALFFFTASTFFKGDCTGKETDPGNRIADEFYLGGAISKKGGVPFVFVAALVFISGPVGTCGLYPVIVH